MSTTRIVILFIVVTTIARAWLATVTGLGFDESYMLGNARQFLWGYVDQVPMHLWIAGAAPIVFGSAASGFVRLPFVLMFAASSWFRAGADASEPVRVTAAEGADHGAHLGQRARRLRLDDLERAGGAGQVA